MPSSISDDLQRALGELFTDKHVRPSEGGADLSEAWRSVEVQGFAGAPVTAEQGEAGLLPTDACALLIAGRTGSSHPFGETLLARALLAAAGVTFNTDVPGALLALYATAGACRDPAYQDVFCRASVIEKPSRCALAGRPQRTARWRLLENRC